MSNVVNQSIMEAVGSNDSGKMAGKMAHLTVFSRVNLVKMLIWIGSGSEERENERMATRFAEQEDEDQQLEKVVEEEKEKGGENAENCF